MKPSATSPQADADSLSENSREKIRRRYLAACEGSGQAPPPDLDSFLAGYSEPERSELRSELESLQQSAWRGDAVAPYAARSGDGPPTGTTEQPAPGSETVDSPPAADAPTPAGATDQGAADLAGTREYTPGVPVETIDQPKTQPETQKAGGAKKPTSIAGYDILGVLGRGAMGVVYKASQRGLKRTVALKMILSGGHASEHELTRFRSEASAVAQLQHPNIVQIYEVGESEGRPFFSLEFVDGTSLDKKVRDNPLPPREAAQICLQLAQAMEYAHQRGIIHRDLKPANVLLTAAGVPKIGDFGLAKRLEEEDAGLTRTGTVLGTPSYMAPEQAEGKIDELGPRSDVYSLGAILYDLLTGRAPFRGTTLLETLEQVRTREPVPPLQLQPSVPRDLETICLKCLQKDKNRRYQSAAELEADLDRFLKGEPILARPVGWTERLWSWCKRNPRAAGLSATIALVVIAWAVTSSALAWGLKLQKDEADHQTGIAVTQTGIAKKNEEKAIEQTGIAKLNEEKAIEQTGIAKENAAEAVKQTGIAIANEAIAKKNEKAAKSTAEGTVQQMVRLAEQVYFRLQSKRLAASADPELRRLREQVLTNLSDSLKEVSAKIDAGGATRFGEAGTLTAFGDLLTKVGQSEEALKIYHHVHGILTEVAEGDPRSDLARANLAVVFLRLGHVPLNLKGDGKLARDYYLKARDIHYEILTKPRDGYYRDREVQLKVSLAHDDYSLGQAHLSLGDPAEAYKYLEECLTFRQAWCDAEPKSMEASSYLMQARMYLGIAASGAGDEKALREHFGKALQIGAGLIQRAPKDISFKADLADVQGADGDALLRLGQVDDAVRLYEEAMKNLEIVFKNNPDDVSNQSLLALTHERLAAAFARQGKKGDSEKHHRDALRLRVELLQIEPNNLSRQAAFMLALARAGKHADAATGAANMKSKVAQSTELQLQLARCWAVCAAQDSEKKSKYVEQAMEMLQAATKENFKNLVVLQTDPDLEALRDRPAFTVILEQVKAR